MSRKEIFVLYEKMDGPIALDRIDNPAQMMLELLFLSLAEKTWCCMEETHFVSSETRMRRCNPCPEC